MKEAVIVPGRRFLTALPPILRDELQWRDIESSPTPGAVAVALHGRVRDAVAASPGAGDAGEGLASDARLPPPST